MRAAKKTNAEKLNETVAFLKKVKTAAQVAEHFGISPFAAYERLRGAVRAGKAKKAGKIDGPGGKTGPKSQTWVAL